ncbi:ArnT family glycosyltransferase [Sunxiuqinia sp. sy24]|uniref:ArnT family glycosyltransferase n=1 Tax=Sunxiuqinia sp. sy24 TaxID=3461495 RepID=UPI00404678F7
MKKEKWLLLGIILYLLINITGLFIPIVINAAKYAQVGREILDNHNWTDLTIGGDAYDQKPPLLFWIAAAVFQVTGISVFAYKLSILLISLIGVYGTFKLGELLYDKRTGILSAFFWASCLGYVHFHNDIHTDTLLVVPVILAIWKYAAWIKHQKNAPFYLGTLFLGLALLSKGPVAIVIVGSAVGLHLLLTRNFKMLLNIRSFIAIVILMLSTLPALWGLYQQFGIEGIKFYFWTNNAGRISGSYAGSNTDPFFYIHTTLYMIAPWIAFSFVGIFLQIREKITLKLKATPTDEFYTLGGILIYLIILSSAKAKNPHYELAILPLLSIIAARWAYLIFEKPQFIKLKRALGTIHLTIAIVLFILAAALLFYIFPNHKLWIWFVTGLITAAFCYVLSWKAGLNKQLTYLLLAISALLFTLNAHILPNLSHYQSSFKACEAFNQQAGPNEKLHIYTEESRYWEIFLYSKNYGRYMVTPEDFKQINPPENDWLYTGPKGLEQLAKMNIPVDTVSVFLHKSMTSLPLKFLNPKTRASKLKPRYLVQLKEK